MSARQVLAGILSLFLISCTNSDVQDGERSAGSGEVVEESETENGKRIMENEEEDGMDGKDEIDGSEENPLELLYEDALDARDAVTALLPDLDADLRTEVDGVLVTFSEHIDALRYFIDESETRELNDEETLNLLEVLSDTQIMIDQFVVVMDSLTVSQ